MAKVTLGTNSEASDVSGNITITIPSNVKAYLNRTKSGGAAPTSYALSDLPRTDVTVYALFGIAVTYGQELGETQKGIEVFERLVEQFPNHSSEDMTHYLLARHYKVLKDAGKIEAAKADEKIEQNLTTIVEKYPDGDLAPHVAMQLAPEKFKKGQWQKAAAYYEIYLAKFPGQLRYIIGPLGQCYERMGDSGTAAEIYRAYILSADANDPGVKP